MSKSLAEKVEAALVGNRHLIVVYKVEGYEHTYWTLCGATIPLEEYKTYAKRKDWCPMCFK